MDCINIGYYYQNISAPNTVNLGAFDKLLQSDTIYSS